MKTTLTMTRLQYRSALEAVQYLAAATEKNRLESQQVQYLLCLAEAGPDGISMTEVTERLQVDQSGVSRNTKAFGPAVMAKPLVKQWIDPVHTKFRLVALTDYGREVVDTFIEKMAEATAVKKPARKS